MFGEAASLEHVLQLLLAPAAARLGRVAQRIDQFGGLAADLLLADPHRFDQAGEIAERVAPFLLDLGDTLLVALEAFGDRLEQSLEPLPRRLLGLLEARVGAFEEILLCLVEQFGADLGELRGKRVLGLGQFLQPQVEIADVGVQCGVALQRLVAFARDLAQRHPDQLARLCPLLRARRGNLGLADARLQRVALGADRGRGPSAEKPADAQPREQDQRRQ